MRAPRSLLAVALLALAAAACSGSGGPTGSGDDAPPPAGSPSGTLTPGAPEPTSSPGRAADEGKLAPAPPPPGEAPQSAPPAAGIYRYRQSGTGVTGDIPEEGTLQIKPARIAGDAQRQRQIRTISDGQIAEQILLFRDDVVLVEEITQRFGSGALAQAFTCTFDPPLRVVRLPVKPGASWSDSSSCRGLTIELTASIAKGKTFTVGGVSVQTFLLKTTLRASNDDFEQTTQTSSWISEDHRLPIRTEQRSEGSQGAVTFSSSLTESLLSLDPA